MINKSLFLKTTPIMLGYVPLGIAFGLITIQSGMEWYIAPLFSLLAFAGAIQFLAIPMLLSSESYLTIAIATFLVNFRHVFYGISLLKFLPETFSRKMYFIFCTTDENYSLLTSSDGISKSDAIKIVFLNHSYWILGALIGALLGREIQIPNGLDFALTALFCVLFLEQVKRNPSKKLIAIAVAVSVLTLLIAPNQFMITSSFLVLVLLAIDYNITTNRSQVIIDE